MEYCVVASNYRTEKQQVHVFLDNVVVRFVDRGITCNVVAPQSLVRYLFKGNARRKKVDHRVTPGGKNYTVYSPVYLVFPAWNLGRIHLSDFSKKSFFRAVRRVYKKKKMKADLVYSHFIHAGMAGVWLAKELGVPSYIANGEADTIHSLRNLSPSLVRQTLADVTGIISVSTKNKNEILDLYGDESILKKTRVIVNAADSQRFYKRDQAQCRKELGFPEDAFIVSYTGSFIPRKGTKMLSRVLDRLDDVYSVFIGVGEDKPDCKNILHMGKVPNEKIGTYLCASDVFVLPTQAEGCCNAIVEALSCGVPVISSDRPFNHDILDDSCGILIDPDSEEELEKAIRSIREDPQLRQYLAQGSLRRGESLSLDKRVDNLLRSMQEQSNEIKK